MKRSNFIKTGIAALSLSLAAPGSVQAQLVYSSLTDPLWYTSSGSAAAGDITGINTAMIDFNSPVTGAGTLIVSDYYGNGTAGGIVFTDQGSGFTIQVPYHVSGPTANFYVSEVPDIIVGNDAFNPRTDYRVAMAYECLNTLTGTTWPQIDYWLVHYSAPGVFTATYFCSSMFTTIKSSTTIHIDIIAEAGNVSTTGFPWCDKFAVAMDGKLATAGVLAYYGSLNAPVCDPVAPTPIVTGGIEPDVAAIQRQIPLPPAIDNIALITYVDQASGDLDYLEWDITATTISPVVILVSGGPTASFSYPRIDAPDDYTINNPAIPLRSYYKVVAQAEATGTSAFTPISCDNQTFGSAPFTTYPPGTSDEYGPTVAFGGNNSTQYQVAHNSNDNSLAGSGYPYINTFMEPIDWGNPNSLALSPPPVSSFNYFLVNYTPFNPVTSYAAGFFLTAISTPCNNTGHETLVAWTYYDLLAGYSNVWYKTTPYGLPYGYTFRQAAPAEVTNASLKDWNVYPNPATGTVTIDNPVAAAARYEITDMPGRTVLSGSIGTGAQTIDVSTLCPGSYIISVYEGDRGYTKVFVKQ